MGIFSCWLVTPALLFNAQYQMGLVMSTNSNYYKPFIMNQHQQNSLGISSTLQPVQWQALQMRSLHLNIIYQDSVILGDFE